MHKDERGSVIALTNASGGIIAINAYDEYGIPASTNIGRFQYTGQTWIDELGMYYYKARIYSPTLGRFLQSDPIGYGDGMNIYAYVGGDPINFVDPTGLKAHDVIIVTATRLPYCQRAANANKYRCTRGDLGRDNSGNNVIVVTGIRAVGDGGGPKKNIPACPVKTPAVITGAFGAKRKSGPHSGVDLRARPDAPIYAPLDGIVRHAGPLGRRGGNSIIIDSSDGSVYGFAHTGPVVSKFDKVTKGQLIGRSDGSGTGVAHLHLTYRKNRTSSKSDPLKAGIQGACNAVPK